MRIRSSELGWVEGGGRRRQGGQSQRDGTAWKGEAEDGSGAEGGCFEGGRAPGRLGGDQGVLDWLATRVLASSPCPAPSLDTAVSGLG